MTDAMAKERWVSFYEVYGTPDGLGTAKYKDVFVRGISLPHKLLFQPRHGCINA